jgi:hypothetical protein
MKFKKFGKALLMSALSAGVVLSVTSCVQSYSVGFLYVTGTVTSDPSGNGIISGFKIDHNTGKLSPVAGLPVSSGGANPVRAILISGQRFLYVLNRGVSTNPAGSSICTLEYPCTGSNITQFAIGGNGVLTPQETFYTQGINPFRILEDSSGGYIYVLDHDSPANTSPSAGDACNLALGSDLTTGLPVTSCGDITAFQVNSSTGRLTLVVNTQVTTANCGTSSATCPLTYFPVPANPIDFLFGSNVILTMSGTPATGDSVFPYTYSAGNGQLTVNANSSQPLSSATTANGLVDNATAFVMGSGYLYVLDNDPITYTPSGSTSPITAPSQILPYTVGTNGALQAQTGGAIPDDPTLANPTYLVVKGSWLYIANSGTNETTTATTQDGIAGYIVDPSTHQLSFMPGEPFTVGSAPQCIVMDPSSQYLYEANFNDSTVTGQSIDQNKGVLRPLSESTNVPSSYTITGPATWCVVDGRTS